MLLIALRWRRRSVLCMQTEFQNRPQLCQLLGCGVPHSTHSACLCVYVHVCLCGKGVERRRLRRVCTEDSTQRGREGTFPPRGNCAAQHTKQSGLVEGIIRLARPCCLSTAVTSRTSSAARRCWSLKEARSTR